MIVAEGPAYEEAEADKMAPVRRFPEAKRGKTVKDRRVITSSMVLGSATEECSWPMRFAGTCYRYSKNAMPQPVRTTANSGASLNF